MRAADALCEALKAEGVKHVFGIPGGANLPTYDALYDAEIEHIQVRHEQGGGTPRRATRRPGKVGVALATSGPGATNMVTAIADAIMDSVPTVFITGQVRTELIGTDGFQEADVTGITLPIVKHSLLVTDPRQIPEYVHNAFYIASTGRPGPVLIDVPRTRRAPTSSTSRAPAPRTCPLQAVDGGEHQADPAGREGARQRAATGDLRRRRDRERERAGGVPRVRPRRSLRHADRDGARGVPCARRAVAGDAGDARDAGRQLRDGRGRPDRRRRLRFDDRITGKLSEFAPRAKFIHIDVDPAEISKNVPAHIPIVGDAKDVLPKLTDEYRALRPDGSRLEEWWKRIAEWREQYPLRYEDSEDSRSSRSG